MSYTNTPCNKMFSPEGCQRSDCWFSHNKNNMSNVISIKYSCHREGDYIIGQDENDEGYYIQWTIINNYLKLNDLISENIDYSNMIFYGYYDKTSKDYKNNRYRFVHITNITESKRVTERLRIQKPLTSPIPTAESSMARSFTDNQLSPINLSKDLDDFKKTLDGVNTLLNENSGELTSLKEQFKEQFKEQKKYVAELSSLKEQFKEQFKEQKKYVADLTSLKEQFKEQKKYVADLQLMNSNNNIVISDQQIQILKLKEILNKRPIEERTVYNLRKRSKS